MIMIYHDIPIYPDHPDHDPDDDDDDDDQIKSNRERYVDPLGPRHRCIEGQLTPSHLACLSIFLNYI